MHTLKDIKTNQNNYKEEIIKFLSDEFHSIKKNLNKIRTQDKTIISKKKELKKKFKKFTIDDYLKTFLIDFPGHRRHFYALWDKYNEEVKIYKYDKRTKK